jgi:2-keto-4-pentenoate hydratase/2-oxohepta-3-ene-1,7-dioic acid hydratase in catechol pathway
MRLYTIIADGAHRVAVEAGDGNLVDLFAAEAAPMFNSMLALIEAGQPALDAARKLAVAPPAAAIRKLSDVALAAPIPRPSKIRGFSVFERHGRQSVEGVARIMSARAPDPEAAYQQMVASLKFPPGWAALPGNYYMDNSTVTGHDSTVIWPAYSHWVDYELELAAVIGCGGKDIARESAWNHVFGYTILNDLSARDAQLQGMATGLGPGKGKDFDSSNPMGPCIVTADEIPDPYALKVSVKVNGEVWSSTDGSEAHFRYDECIAHVSQSQTIYPGEFFSTGTFPDCSSVELQKMVKRGDRIEFEVEKIGTLAVTIA